MRVRAFKCPECGREALATWYDDEHILTAFACEKEHRTVEMEMIPEDYNE